MKVYGVVWNPFTIDTDGSGTKTVAPTMFLTYGVKHLKIWTLAKDEVSCGDHPGTGGWGGREQGTEGPAATRGGRGETAASAGQGVSRHEREA